MCAIGIRACYSPFATGSVKKTISAVFIIALALLLGAGDNHEHRTAAVCAGCLHAPVLIDHAKIDIAADLTEFGVAVSDPGPQRVSRFAASFTQLRAPPLV